MVTKFVILAKFSAIAVMALIVQGCTYASISESGPSGFAFRSLSSRADMVSGDDVLVELNTPTGQKWAALLNGRDVGSSFHRTPGSAKFVARLTGLRSGKNTLEVQDDTGAVRSRLDIVDHPVGTSIFSGPRHGPVVCWTEVQGLGPPLDTDCRAPSRVEYYYKSNAIGQTEGSADRDLDSYQRAVRRLPPGIPRGFKYYDPNHPPSDLAQTVTSLGETVPYIVRREYGVIDRTVYDIRVLHQPGTPLPTPWSDRRGAWNGRLVYLAYGAGCAGGTGAVILYRAESDEAVIAKGYATIASTYHDFSGDCSPVTSAETFALIKEHFIKDYGVPVHTIGWGPSNASMAQYFDAQNYPGLLDGIVPSSSFPDTTTWVISNSDCRLLLAATEKSKLGWNDNQKAAISGFKSWGTCVAKAPLAAFNPRECPEGIPRNQIYDAAVRSEGIRCDYFSNRINYLGRDPKNGLAASTLDNVGVQYGLVAFNSGRIDAERFIELNELIGGLDSDGNLVASRMAGDAEAVRRAYQSGLVLSGDAGLPQTPIIDFRVYVDDADEGSDPHVSFESLVVRARLIAANGSAGNQVIVTYPMDPRFVFTDPNPEFSLEARAERDLIRDMDRWLDNIQADRRAGSPIARVARNRPANVVDRCWTKNGRDFGGSNVYDANGACRRHFPIYGDPRVAAGAPLTNDILKCRLQPVDATQYKHRLTARQLQRLKAVFPSGVCDYRRRGFGMEATHLTWQVY